MLVNVTDVFTSEGKVLTQEFAWETAEITHDGSSYPVKNSSKLLLKLTNTAQGEALVEAKDAALQMKTEADKDAWKK